MKRRKLIAGLLLAGALFGAASTRADEFAFSYSSTGITASGTFFTAPEQGGSFLITGISGTRNGETMTLISPNGFAANDNLLFPSAPFLDFSGFSFVAGGIDYNVYFNTPACCGGVQAYYEDATATAASLGTLVNFSGTAVPEPSILALCLSGLWLLVGLTLAARSDR